MNIRLEKEIPMTAQELYRILRTSEFTTFLTNEYGVYADIEIQEKCAGVSAQKNHPDRHELQWRLSLPVLRKKFQAFGMLQLFHLDESRCFVILEGNIHIGRFGVGRLLERKVVKRVKRESDQFSNMIAKWKSVSNKCGKLKAGDME
jgi:hypothetical protein